MQEKLMLQNSMKKMKDKKEDLVNQKKLDKDKDGDLDAKDFAMISRWLKRNDDER